MNGKLAGKDKTLTTAIGQCSVDWSESFSRPIRTAASITPTTPIDNPGRILAIPYKVHDNQFESAYRSTTNDLGFRKFDSR